MACSEFRVLTDGLLVRLLVPPFPWIMLTANSRCTDATTSGAARVKSSLLCRYFLCLQHSVCLAQYSYFERRWSDLSASATGYVTSYDEDKYADGWYHFDPRIVFTLNLFTNLVLMMLTGTRRLVVQYPFCGC